VQFAHGSARIEPTSYALLDDIAHVMIVNPQIERISIHGNAAQGEPHAERLAQQSATAVRDALVARGVDTARLEIRGDGTARPLAPNATEHGRTLNRRADFEITRIAEPSSPPTVVVVPRSPPGCPGMSSPPPPSAPPRGRMRRDQLALE
jgi:outer membrane protein OmpA-like peptidoglycan-associated protein